MGGGVTEETPEPEPEPGIEGITFYDGANTYYNFTWDESYITKEVSGTYTIIHVNSGGLKANGSANGQQTLLLGVRNAEFVGGQSVMELKVDFSNGINLEFDIGLINITGNVNIGIE